MSDSDIYQQLLFFPDVIPVSFQSKLVKLSFALILFSSYLYFILVIKEVMKHFR